MSPRPIAASSVRFVPLRPLALELPRRRRRRAQHVAACQLLPAAIGGVIGVGAGGYVALGVITLEARRGTYLFGLDDALGWESAAVLAGGGAGVILGAWDQNRLRSTVFGSIAGAVVGTGVGALVGRRIWPPPEGKWAGGVIGGAAGVLVGAGVGMLMPQKWLGGERDADNSVPVAIRIPVGE